MSIETSTFPRSWGLTKQGSRLKGAIKLPCTANTGFDLSAMVDMDTSGLNNPKRKRSDDSFESEDPEIENIEAKNKNDAILLGLRDLDAEMQLLSLPSKAGGKGKMPKEDALRIIGIISKIREAYFDSLTRLTACEAKSLGVQEVTSAILKGIQEMNSNREKSAKNKEKVTLNNPVQEKKKKKKSIDSNATSMVRPTPPAESEASGGQDLTYAEVANGMDTAETVDGADTFTLVKNPKKSKKKKVKKNKDTSAKRTRRRQVNKAIVLHLTGKGSGDILQELKTHVKPSDSGLRIKAVKHTKDNGVLVVTDKDSDLKAISENEELKKAGFQFSEPRKPKPKVVIRNVVADLENDEMLSVLGKQNNLEKEMSEARVVFKTSSKTGSTDRNWVIEMTQEARTKLIRLGRLYITWESCRVQDYLSPVRCFRCQCYGHMAKSCVETESTCYHCAEKGHDAKACPATTTTNAPPPSQSSQASTAKTATATKSIQKCPPCTKNKYRNDHTVGSNKCKTHKNEVDRMKYRMSYV